MLSVKKLIYKILECPHVVEQGTSGSWTYRKWSDGTSECWCKSGNVTFATNTQYGGVYYGSAYGFESFPSGLFTNNMQTISIELLGGDGCWAGINVITATSFSFYPYCSKNGNHVCSISVHVVGKWK